MQKTKSGFTIVELLIVIVVIAILAAISIVAYNGIQDRAKNNATIQAASQVQKLMNAYTVGTSSLLANGVYCMTRDNVCTTDSGSTSVSSDNSSLITSLEPYGSLPNSVPYPAGLRTSYQAGRTVDGNLARLFLIYWIKGTNINCGLQTLVSTGTATWTLSSTGYSSSTGGWTYCVVPVQDHSSV